ncbi:hypothetical protein FRC02_000208 [Tulasnella sp. 418]|nr:hypothetical protein FRC02_000208 [Tulasnella sp. 418]
MHPCLLAKIDKYMQGWHIKASEKDFSSASAQPALHHYSELLLSSQSKPTHKPKEMDSFFTIPSFFAKEQSEVPTNSEDGNGNPGGYCVIA